MNNASGVASTIDWLLPETVKLTNETKTSVRGLVSTCDFKPGDIVSQTQPLLSKKNGSWLFSGSDYNVRERLKLIADASIAVDSIHIAARGGCADKRDKLFCEIDRDMKSGTLFSGDHHMVLHYQMMIIWIKMVEQVDCCWSWSKLGLAANIEHNIKGLYSFHLSYLYSLANEIYKMIKKEKEGSSIVDREITISEIYEEAVYAYCVLITCGYMYIPNNGTDLYSSSSAHAFDLIVSFLNHSCCPNVMPVFKETGDLMTLVVLKPIHKGDELLMSYTDMLEPRGCRHEHLNANYQFVCKCAVNFTWDVNSGYTDISDYLIRGKQKPLVEYPGHSLFSQRIEFLQYHKDWEMAFIHQYIYISQIIAVEEDQLGILFKELPICFIRLIQLDMQFKKEYVNITIPDIYNALIVKCAKYILTKYPKLSNLIDTKRATIICNLAKFDTQYPKYEWKKDQVDIVRKFLLYYGGNERVSSSAFTNIFEKMLETIS